MKKVTPYYVIHEKKQLIRIKTLIYHQICTKFLKWRHVRRVGNNRTPKQATSYRLMGHKRLGKKWHGTTTYRGGVHSTTLRYAGILSNYNFYTISYVPATMLERENIKFLVQMNYYWHHQFVTWVRWKKMAWIRLKCMMEAWRASVEWCVAFYCNYFKYCM